MNMYGKCTTMFYFEVCLLITLDHLTWSKLITYKRKLNSLKQNTNKRLTKII